VSERFGITCNGHPVDSIPPFRGSDSYSWNRSIFGKKYKYILLPQETSIEGIDFPATLIVCRIEPGKVCLVCIRELN
jgi:hypothetical protein